ncbi:MAG TPA: PspA/IM30 family protein [Thermomicrobiales bacterium]|nr:PspA/IM30 family protein [Thermomicrobiales bacterium]
MGILDRMSRLIRANVNDMIDRAEDPEKMLNELLREMDSSIREARVQVANMIAQEKEIESDLQAAQHDSLEWGRRAELAVDNGKDDLAREALRRKRDAEQISEVYGHQLVSQQEVVTTLKQQLTMLEAKFREAESKRSMLIARHRATRAQRTITETLSTLPGLDSQSELARMERRIRTEEAKTKALSEMQGDDLEYQFAELDRDEDIESELAALKDRNSLEDTRSLASGAAEGTESGRDS